MEGRRVVVTGIGAVSPLGLSMAETWNRMIEGHMPAGSVRAFDASGFPCQIAYEVEGFSSADLPLNEDERAGLSRSGFMGVHAALEALQQSGVATNSPSDRKGVCLGVGMGTPGFDWFSNVYLPASFAQVDHTQFKHFPNNVTNTIARLAAAEGEVTTVHTACASSGQSIGDAYESIRYGDMDVMITGGCDSMISPYYFAGFCLLGALSEHKDPRTACRPFDRDRNGFVLGEGACVLVLEDLEHALGRGAEILGEICGYGVSESAYRITDLHPDGRGPIEAMDWAVKNAGIAPEAINYVNAHGTSTKLNDQIEALAIEKVLHSAGNRPWVSSTKSMTGHMISAAGAMELAVVLQCVRYQVVPPSLNYDHQDPDMADVRITPAEPLDESLEYGLSNSVGFGGSNTALIARRWRAEV